MDKGEFERIQVIIRQEKESDFERVASIIQSSFAHEPLSDHSEHHLVARLRKSAAFIPELSLVAEAGGELVGHILLTQIQIKHQTESFDALALAPVSVHPDFQGNGIGSALIREAHQRARDLGHKAIVLLGHADYYPRFGYKKAHLFGVQLPFEVPRENCMAIELIPDALKKVNGVVEYPREFYM